MKKIRDLLQEINDEIDYDKEEKLIDDGLFSSFDIIECIALIEKNFSIKIPASYIKQDNFQSVKNISKMIKKIQTLN
ncbi:hypothetical protein CPIN18021_1670 [Campylobacter pinnipediorum subsp. caledonicus]|uniref:Uncharacterized protein n=1 Tax=Campylobacter pinnipediorum subsp. caledonicus TaxID=1874362 RepID=A0A1S6U9P3_9BACT|nr:hypothetical protein [Campylobacter pinnipediorum]AQW86793.1 hypothetical protein CPIN18020_1616 [Campylobacter pinnipediorum subsp. caledonicus]AQW88448.1 hypothetical protein CPIN18021_1670 [Campylobacter pinnipediorum subsp. caledonicus]OPA72587.1 hypothetical protein BB381_05150 [Campylobacter pinnipediorum subsp. caledonicus]